MNDLTRDFWNEHFNNIDLKHTSKIKEKIYNWLNKDNFGGFVIDRNIFWIELVCTSSRLPNYIYNYLIKWTSKKGYKYLYHV